MAGIKKTDFSAIKKKFSKEAEYKPDRFFDLGDAFLDACGIPGPAMGHINMLLGHSDTGKTTALVKSAVDAQKKGVVPVFVITEQKWSWDHAELMGFDKEGDYLFNSDFEYIEQITEYINELLDALLRTPLFSSAATSFTLSHVADEAAFGYAVAYLISKTCGPSFVDATRCSDNC